MPLTIIKEDITKMKVDAIVNAANTELLMGGGVCGAIFYKAGATELQYECSKLSPIKTGEAVTTSGFALLAKYIIHAVGPIYQQWTEKENQELLTSAYMNALQLAVENHCKSIAFPLISSGIYGYPKNQALQIAIDTIKDFLNTHEMDIYLVLFDDFTFKMAKEYY